MKKPVRYLICRQVDKIQWMIVSNPNWTVGEEQTASIMLCNMANEYVEYENCGIVYRVVRSLEGYEMAED
jgi:hypothetical protein